MAESETAPLCKELVAAFEKIAALEAGTAERDSGTAWLEAKIAALEAKLAVCGGPNAPSLTLSTYNPRRNA